MGKKPIYLDERERDLARRICTVVGEELGTLFGGKVEKFAVHWTMKEVRALGEKFIEPSSNFAPIPGSPENGD